MSNCSQCGKPAIVIVGDHPLCVDCNLKLHPYTIRRLVREKKIPAFKIGGQWRFKKEAINRLINNSGRRK